MTKKRSTHPSSFCNLANGFGEAPPPVMDVGIDPGVALPPPPRRGFAIRPNPSGEADAAFCAEYS